MMDLPKYKLRMMQKLRLKHLTVDNYADIASDVIYAHFFGMDMEDLRKHFGLPRNATDSDIRDCMGIEALVAIDHVEDALVRLFGELKLVDIRKMFLVIWHFTEEFTKTVKAHNPDFKPESGNDLPR